MLWHIYLTRYCNLHCTYCGADPLFETIPHDPQYDISKLVSFLKQDQEPIINFYGGEPLIRIDLMIEIINGCLEDVPNIKFVLQTNGLFLHKIPPEYVKYFHSILVSIDGRPDLTNNYRGKGVFEKLRENLSYISKTCNFSGELIARMTVSKNSDIFKDVTYLLDPINDLEFTHVHWQLDALWNAESWPDFAHWIRNTYNTGIDQLVKWWSEQIKQTEKVPGIIPFQGIMTSLLTESKSQIRCGAGSSSYTISTDGNLIFCPICPEEPEAIVGDLNTKLKDVKKVFVGEPCISCEVMDICGGRCLYTNYFKPGTAQDYTEVCNTTKFLIKKLQDELPSVKTLLHEKKIQKEQLLYPDINNGAEIIP